MERFARTIVGYHGCSLEFSRPLLLGEKPIHEWQPSRNRWDWLGHGIYFWEHSPERALRWAEEKFLPRNENPAVVGAVIQLGQCFDLLDESFTSELSESYVELAASYGAVGKRLPTNGGPSGKRRNLDCLVINDCLERCKRAGFEYDTVRAAFIEGELAYPAAGFYRETHIQIAVRNPACILGVFHPNL